MPKYKVPYVVYESPSFHHSMPDDDMTPVPTTYYREIEAADAAEAKSIVKKWYPGDEVGKPVLIE